MRLPLEVAVVASAGVAVQRSVAAEVVGTPVEQRAEAQRPVAAALLDLVSQ